MAQSRGKQAYIAMDISLHTYTRVGRTMTGCETNMTWGQPALQEIDGTTYMQHCYAPDSYTQYSVQRGVVAISTSEDQVQSHKLLESSMSVSTSSKAIDGVHSWALRSSIPKG